MNSATRTKLEEIQRSLEAHISTLEEIAAEEQDKYDNLPEGLQNGEKGERLSTAAEAAQNGVDEIQSAITSLETAIGYCDEAASQ